MTETVWPCVANSRMRRPAAPSSVAIPDRPVRTVGSSAVANAWISARNPAKNAPDTSERSPTSCGRRATIALTTPSASAPMLCVALVNALVFSVSPALIASPTPAVAIRSAPSPAAAANPAAGTAATTPTAGAIAAPSRTTLAVAAVAAPVNNVKAGRFDSTAPSGRLNAAAKLDKDDSLPLLNPLPKSLPRRLPRSPKSRVPLSTPSPNSLPLRRPTPSKSARPISRSTSGRNPDTSGRTLMNASASATISPHLPMRPCRATATDVRQQPPNHRRGHTVPRRAPYGRRSS
jgi:hypothetical protein